MPLVQLNVRLQNFLTTRIKYIMNVELPLNKTNCLTITWHLRDESQFGLI